MLKNKSKIIAFFMLICLLFTTMVYAENDVVNDEQNPISTNESEEIENSVEVINEAETSKDDGYKKSDVYLSGENITIDYIVDGNVFVCADNVTINSQIGGDAFILAKNLTIGEQAYIFSNLFVNADSIEIKGVLYDLYATSNTINISGGYIYRDIKATCNNLTINGTIGRNAFVNCSNMNFNTIENSKGTIYGDLNYSSTSEISIPENTVNGVVNFNKITSEINKATVSGCLMDLIIFLIIVLFIWLICLLAKPNLLNDTSKFIGKKTLKMFGIGLLALMTLAIPLIIIFLLLLILTNNAVVVSYIFDFIGTALIALFIVVIHNFICTKSKIDKDMAVLGLIVLSAIVVWGVTKIPYIGGIISAICLLLGLGILVYSMFCKNKKEES